MRLSFLFLLIAWSVGALAQQSYVTISAINISGNKKTRNQIITRELDIQPGDTLLIANLPAILERNRLQLLNTGLFTMATMNVKDWDTERGAISVAIEVNENWYLYPIPVFELADRNFNVWWQDQGRSLDRVNFGLRFVHTNITGRADILKAVAQYGYTRKYELEYTIPFINRKQTIGLKANVFYSRNREIFYTTTENRQIFERSDTEDYLQRLRFSANLFYRPGIFFYHDFGVKYFRNKTTDFVIDELNRDYLLDGRIRQKYFSLLYTFTYDRRDIKPYPLKGIYLRSRLQKEGLGVFEDRNAFFLTTTIGHYLPISKKINLENIAKGRLFFIREQQAYYNSRALGFNLDFLRGYELYIIDGNDFAYLKTSLRFELANRSVNFGRFMPFKKLKVMPIRVYLSANSDVGITDNPYYDTNNDFSNRILWGRGLGLDIITYYDKVFQIQYSWNHLGESGVFLHYKLTL